MDRLLDFSGQAVFISGAAGGFGKGLAVEFAKRGANLCLTDINESALSELVAELTQKCSAIQVVALAGDISCEAFHQDLTGLIKREFNGLDIAINNAGIAQVAVPIHKQSLASFQQQLDVNLTGVFLAMRGQLQLMKYAKQGHIVNVSSVAGTEAAPAMAGYSASKHGVLGLTRTAAFDYAKVGIRVNAVCPYLAPTPLIEQTGEQASQAAIAAMSAKHPMGRIAKVDEVVNAIMLLCSPHNTFTNGQALVIDGGVSVY